MNEVAVKWHSEVLQVCWSSHNGAMSGQEEGTDLRPISPCDSEFPFSIFSPMLCGVWWPSHVQRHPQPPRGPTRINKGSRNVFSSALQWILCDLAKFLYWSSIAVEKSETMTFWSQLQPTTLSYKMWCTRGNSSLSKPLQILDWETVEIVCVIGITGPNHAGFPVHRWLLPSHEQHS